MDVQRGDPIPLEITLLGLDGQAKTDVTTATVRVYRIAAGIETEVLPAAVLTRVGTTSTWRLWWEPGALPAGLYTVQYGAADAAGAQHVMTEDLLIVDTPAEQAALLTGIEELRDAALGRKRVDANLNRYTVYRRNGTVLQQYNTFDANGSPATTDICEVTPTP